MEGVATDGRPGDPAVDRLQEAVAEVAVTGQVALAGARIDDRVIRWGYGDGADRQCRLAVGARRPCSQGFVVGPDTALGCAKDLLAVARADRECAHATGDAVEAAASARDLDDRIRADLRPRARECRGRRRREAQKVLAGLMGGATVLGCLVDREVDITGRPATDRRIVTLEDLFCRVVAGIERHPPDLAEGIDFRVAARRDAQRAALRRPREQRRRKQAENECCAEREDYPSAMRETVGRTSHWTHLLQRTDAVAGARCRRWGGARRFGRQGRSVAATGGRVYARSTVVFGDGAPHALVVRRSIYP